MDSSMCSEIEDQPLVIQTEDERVASTKPMRSYTRDFLLSLSDLEVCKKLPDGFDESLLSEFEESSHGMYDRPRVGNSSLQGFKRSDNGSSATSRGDSGSFSRGLSRWDSRSSGKSDTDTDSESGRRYSSQTRMSEHDGLLGSGSFPRPTGAAVPKFRPNNIPLSKSNEPYHPPRSYKAAPHTRREINDSFNDETFGSTDSTSEDRVEEEKKRRAEFEFMRKEQQKVLQEMQKSSTGKLDNPFADITGMLGNSGGTTIDTDELSKRDPQDDVSKHRVTSWAPPSRPLVPPGFVNSVVDKSSTSKSLVHGDQVEVGKSESKEIHRDVGSVVKESGLSDPNCDPTGLSAAMSEKTPTHHAADQVKISDLSDVTRILENGDILGLNSKISEPKLLGDPTRSTSILEKLFGNATTIDSSGTSNTVENDGAKANDIGSPTSFQSKFASWFIEEDMNQNIANSSDVHTNKKPLEDISPRKPNDLLSLIVGGDMSPEMGLSRMNFNTTSSTSEIREQFSSSKEVDPKPAVLTCEDLEQSILLGIGGNDSNSQLNEHKSHVLDVKGDNPFAGIDNQASQHLLSLLQRGTESKNVTLFSENESPHKSCENTTDNIGSGDVEGSHNSGKTLTLEALFGTAFMKELHSAQRGSVGSTEVDVSDHTGVSFLESDGAPLRSGKNEVVNGISDNDGSSIAVLNEGIGKPRQSGYWLGYHDPGKEVLFSKPPTLADSNFERFEGGVGLRVLEEDGSINLGDPVNAKDSVLMPNSDSFGRVRQDPMSVSGPHDMVKPEFPYQNLHRQATLPLLHGQQMNHSKPLFPPLDSHPVQHDPHMKLLPRDAIIHRDVPMHFQFPGNMGPHPLHRSGGLPSFDHPVPPTLSQMHDASNLPPSHLERRISTGAPMPHLANHNSAGYVHERNAIQGFPFGGQRQSSFGTPGFAPPGLETNNPPEAFQRLLEMELRANPKQMIPPFAGVGPSRAMYGHELDMGFRYR